MSDPARRHPPGRLPPVRVLLPDREVGGRLVRRWQTDTGRWVYVVALHAWASRTASTGQDLIEVDVPGDRVRPVPGTSYEGVKPRCLARLPSRAAVSASACRCRWASSDEAWSEIVGRMRL
ncbi:hypothetical protein ACFWCB_11285 [Streptomyces sp. NPDC060048]|uniref:hypothetical protein n=1 Tax=unclassified Streptomyces TaxID=2593676 RepID=UPI00367C5395